MVYLYTRDDQGLIEYHGRRNTSVKDELDDAYPTMIAEFRPQPETEELLGWPHSSVTWYGNLGFGQD